MTRAGLTVLVASISWHVASYAEVVIIDDSIAPVSEQRAYSETCPNDKTYVLEVAIGRDHKRRLAVRYGGRRVAITDPELLGRLTRSNVDNVRMRCSLTSGEFDIVLAGSVTPVSINDRRGVTVYPAYTSGSATGEADGGGRSNGKDAVRR